MSSFLCILMLFINATHVFSIWIYSSSPAAIREPGLVMWIGWWKWGVTLKLDDQLQDVSWFRSASMSKLLPVYSPRLDFTCFTTSSRFYIEKRPTPGHVSQLWATFLVSVPKNFATVLFHIAHLILFRCTACNQSSLALDLIVIVILTFYQDIFRPWLASLVLNFEQKVYNLLNLLSDVAILLYPWLFF